MKNLYLLIVGLSLFYSCGEGAENESENQETTITNGSSESDTTTELFTLSSDKTWDDILGNGETEPFQPFDKVKRYATDDLNHFNVYQFKDIFEFAFPEEPTFETTEKDGYQSHQISKVHNGTIYSIEVLDYTLVDSFEHDMGFVKYTHKDYIKFINGAGGSENYVETMYNLEGYYSYYEFETNDQTYMEDLLTLGFDKYLLMIQITSRPKYEAQSKVQEFVNALKLL